MMKKLVVVLFIALVFASGYALSLWRQVDANRQQIADLQTQLQEAQDAQQASAAELARQARVLADSPAAIAPATSAAPAAAPQPAVSAATSALVEEMRQRMTDPQGKDVRRAQTRMLLPQLNPGISKWLELTPEQENQLFDLMARQQSEQSATILDPANRNDPAAQQEAMRRLQAQNQANEADLAALLGDKYPKYQEYKQTTAVHRQVGQLQAMVGSGSEGLPDAQAKALTAALVAEQLRINQERSNTPPATPGRSLQETMQLQQQRTVEANRRLLQVAASQLNPQQLASYRTLIEQQERSSDVLSRQLGAAEAAAAAARSASDR